MDETRNDAPLTGEAPQPAKPQPLRRVGSFTLGVCLIAAGIFFLLAYFVPGVDWKLMLKIAPAAGLILLGGEVLFFAARPGRWKYDFWSVLICLVLMAGCFGLSLLPVVWDELGPERNQASMKLGQEYTTEAYDKIKQTAPDIRVKNISGNAVSYTHLDVYKRQMWTSAVNTSWTTASCACGATPSCWATTRTRKALQKSSMQTAGSTLATLPGWKRTATCT